MTSPWLSFSIIGVYFQFAIRGKTTLTFEAIVQVAKTATEKLTQIILLLNLGGKKKKEKAEQIVF